MSVVSRLLKRQNYPELKRAVDNALFWPSQALHNEIAGMKVRLFSTPAKTAPLPQQNAEKPETKSESPPKSQAPGAVAQKPAQSPSVAAAQKTQSPQAGEQGTQPVGASAAAQKTSAVPVQKTQTPQAVAKPVQKAQGQQAVVSKAAAPSTSTGQKIQAGQPAQKTAAVTPKAPTSSGQAAATGAGAQAAAIPAAASRVSSGGAARAQGGSGASAGSAAAYSPGSTAGSNPNRLKALLASGVVGSLVIGLLYWQTPRLHDGPAETGGKGKGDESGAYLPSEQDSGTPSPEVEKPEAAEDSEQTAAKILLEPEAVIVETPSVDSSVFEEPAGEEGHKQETESSSVLPEQSQPDDSSSPIPEANSIIVEIEPEENAEIVIELQPQESSRDETQHVDDTVVTVTKEADGHPGLSEGYLLQRGHEELVKKHNEGDAATHDDKQTGLDVVTAIHAAEQRQAEIDAAVFREQLQLLEEKHQHELQDVEHKASWLLEQSRRLQEDMEREKQRHAESLKLQQEESESRLQSQLHSKEEETQRKLEEVWILAKNEAETALLDERVSYLDNISSVKVHMEAMNIALDAKSEEACEGHEIKQLSLGSFVLEDALLKGAPLDKEAAALLKSAGGDPLVEVVVKSLPEEVLKEGTLTPAELDRRLEAMEGTLRELALIPPSGGGVLCHLLARLASALKLPDHGKHADLGVDLGVDAVLSQVQAYIREGDLADAAEMISQGLSGTNAEKLAQEWASQARNRAILEQVCAVLRAHAAAMALNEH